MQPMKEIKYGNIANSFENFPAVYQLTRNANGKVDKHKTSSKEGLLKRWITGALIVHNAMSLHISFFQRFSL